MARAFATAAVLGLALAACSVEVEGAPCQTPGSTAQCPSDQACGVDARCSTRATQCLDPGQRCVPGKDRRCGEGERIEACTAADPCGAWVSEQDCSADGRVCNDSGAPMCEGGPCSTPGSTAECPPGQACGVDATCSSRATQCLDPGQRCVPGSDRRCAEGERIEGCTAADPCGAWVPEQDCSASGLMCDGSGGVPSCVPVPCQHPGSTAECPAGQACGVALVCSARATECVDPGQRCVPGERRCGTGERVETCTAADPCGAWQSLASDPDCSADGRVCDASGGAPSCVCAAPTSAIVVDPSAPNGTLVPTGAASPAACRFRTLTAALAYAKDVWMPAHAGAAVAVRAAGTPSAGAPVEFTAETFPLRIPSGVTLTTASQPRAPELWVISANPQAATNAVELESGATIEGFTVRSVSATGDALVASCATEPGAALVRDVVVDGNAVARYGLSVTGTCGVDASDLVITGATKSGVLVNTSSSSVGLTLTGGSVHGNAESGAEVLGGLLSLQGRSAAGGDVLFDLGPNTRHGVQVAPGGATPKPVDVRLNLVDVHDHGEVGVLVRDLATASKVHVTSCRIRRNTGTAAYSVYGNGRIAGGALLWGGMPSEFEFQRNTVCANATDQIGVYSDDRWNLSAADCTSSNVFVRPGTGYYVYSTTELPGVQVPAINNRWSPNPPTTSLVLKTTYAPSCGSVSTVPSFCQ